MVKAKKLNKGSAGQNRKASESYLGKYATKPGTRATGSGLLYRALEPGQGLMPTEQDAVVVNQRILGVDGKVIWKLIRPPRVLMLSDLGKLPPKYNNIW